MPKVALVETKPSRTNFKKEFDDEFEFDQYQLCSDPGIKKVLKRDCDIEIDVDAYDWLILVGSDALKYFTSVNSSCLSLTLPCLRLSPKHNAHGTTPSKVL